VLMEPTAVSCAPDRLRIVAVPPLMREMMVYATRWPIDRNSEDPVSDAFFQTFGHLVAEAIEHEAPLHLPTTDDELISAAIVHTLNHLDSVTATDLCRTIGVSERTFRRQFRSALNMSWRSYVVQARLLRAMVLLAEPGPTVLDVSIAVEFENVGSFARAFVRQCGETPSVYMRRVQNPEP
jgi:AraC-like DNA-binding protein